MTVLHQAKAFFGLSYGALGDSNLVKENLFLFVITTASDLDQGVFITEDSITEFEIFVFEFLHQLRDVMFIEVDNIFSTDLRRLYHI
jgi:hypothetical protein